MKVSRLFSAPPGAMVRSSLVRRQQTLRQPVEEAEHRARELSRKRLPGEDASRKHRESPKLTVPASNRNGCDVSNKCAAKIPSPPKQGILQNPVKGQKWCDLP